MKKVLKDKLNILIIFISIFLILLCFNRSLWGDEAWTAIIMKYDFKEMIREIGQDVHPPLYFVLLKLIVTLFGQHINYEDHVSNPNNHSYGYWKKIYSTYF